MKPLDFEAILCDEFGLCRADLHKKIHPSIKENILNAMKKVQEVVSEEYEDYIGNIYNQWK